MTPCVWLWLRKSLIFGGRKSNLREGAHEKPPGPAHEVAGLPQHLDICPENPGLFESLHWAADLELVNWLADRDLAAGFCRVCCSPLLVSVCVLTFSACPCGRKGYHCLTSVGLCLELGFAWCMASGKAMSVKSPCLQIKDEFLL